MNSKRYIKISCIIASILSFILILLGAYIKNLSLVIIATSLMSLVAVCFSLIEIRTRMIFLFFVLSLNFFLLSRPIIDWMTGFRYHNTNYYRDENGIIALFMIYLAMLALIVGVLIADYLSKHFKTTKICDFDSRGRDIIIKILSIIFVISVSCYASETIERIVYRFSHSYFDLYAHFRSSLPFYVIGFSRVLLGTVLALLYFTKDSKKQNLILIIYASVTSLTLLTGTRAPLGKALVFIAIYLLLRSEMKFIDKKQIIRNAIIFTVVLVVLTSLFFYVGNARFGVTATDGLSRPVRFFYDQGISFTAITRGIDFLQTDIAENKNYALGPLLDELSGVGKRHSMYSLEYVEQGNSFASDLAYHLYKEKFLNGLGLGSSYLIELFSEYKWYGIVVFNLLLGMLLRGLNYNYSGVVLSIIQWRMISDLFYIPRAQAIRFILVVFEPQLWLPLLTAIVGMLILKRLGGKNGNQNIINI